MKTKQVCILIIFIISQYSFGQETHYWFNNFGARSSLRGGIESASVRNVSAIYYNPAGLAFVDGAF